MTKVKVLFVCLGNICRSPLAEGIFKQKVLNKGLSDHFVIDSCGTSSYHIGEQPDPRSCSNALENGLRLNHKARQFLKTDHTSFDYILPMDSSNLQNVVRLKPLNPNAEVILMRQFDENEKGADVPDPYFGGEMGFQNVYDILDNCCENLLDFICLKHNIS